MADDSKYLDTSTQQQQLRQALCRLHDAEEIPSARLVRVARLGCNRATLDKFRTGRTRRLNSDVAGDLWTYVFANHPTALGLPAASTDNTAGDGPPDDTTRLFAALTKYYDAHKARHGARSEWLTGRYRLFQYSEEFNGHDPIDLPCAIVLSTLIITAERGLVTVEEMQAYDGSLGKTPMTETSVGVCLPKGHEFFFLMKTGPRETPKFCVIHKVHYDGQPRRAQWMKGYMLKGSYDEAYFHTPIYAVRQDGSSETDCNIMHPSKIPPHILTELTREARMSRIERQIRNRFAVGGSC
jgi:hypothetical protein